MTKKYLIQVSDPEFSGGEAYFLSDEVEDVSKPVIKALVKYLEFAYIDNVSGFVNDTLKHHDSCSGCKDPKKAHEFSISAKEQEFDKWGIDSDYDISYHALVLALDDHPLLKGKCEDLLGLLELEKLLRITHVDWEYKRNLKEISNIFFECSY